MFTLPPDERLSAWSRFRKQLEVSHDPLNELIEFWYSAPFIPFNKNVDPYNSKSWPTPWEIIVENKYDDFTKALLMSWTLKLTDKFKDSKIEIKTYIDGDKKRQYNLIFINNESVLNYFDDKVSSIEVVPESFFIENIIEVQQPR
jgi:hypothetical protein